MSTWKNGFIKTAAATLAYAVLHSIFASRAAKDSAARIVGERVRNALYRPFYLGQSAVTMIALVIYVRSQPTKVLYDYRGLRALPFRLVQVAGMLWAAAGALEVGLAEILGIRPALQLVAGVGEIPPEPAAQGPAADQGGKLKVAGPFRLVRHPLNLAPQAIMWFFPKMTTNLLAFNLVSCLYLIVGSKLEETRLVARYGNAYRRYRESGVPFYIPTFKPIAPFESAETD